MSTPLVPILRDYQQQCVANLRRSYARGHRAPVLVLPTRGGKTIVFAEFTRDARAKGNRVLVVVYRRELLKQAAGKLAWAGVPFGIIAAGFDSVPDELVQVASVQTLANRLHKLPIFDLTVFDEGHHCRAATWRRLLKAQPNAKLLGVTATPARLDGKGLGVHARGPLDHLVVGPAIAELVAVGFLSPTRCFAAKQRLDLSSVKVRAGDYVSADLANVVDKAAIVGDAVAQYRVRADHQPAIAFCCTVEHAEHVAETFRTAGYRSAFVHGKTRATERDVLIAGLGNGSIEVLTSCELISEGLDVPSVGAVILLRPTKSLVQQIGRGMPPAPRKELLIVLDHVANTLVHGVPDGRCVWTLAGGAEKTGRRAMWTCPECDCVNRFASRECAGCGYLRPPPQAKPGRFDETPGDLAELTAERLARVRRFTFGEMLREGLSEAELREFARARGCKQGWVFHRLSEQMLTVSPTSAASTQTAERAA